MFDEVIATLAYKTAFRAFLYLRMRNPAVYINTLFSTANHSSLESQVELTGMLSSREQNPLPIPPQIKKRNRIKLNLTLTTGTKM